MDEGEVTRQLEGLELELLDPAERRSGRGEELLSASFLEHGSSGRVWSRSETLASMAFDPGDSIEVEDLVVHRLSPDVALLTYRARGATEPSHVSLRSSVWRRENDGWRIVFHQGTRASATATHGSPSAREAEGDVSKRLQVVRVDRPHEQTVDNLLQQYCHDMAEWLRIDADEEGRYPYRAEKIWQGEVEAYVAFADRIPIGLALVGSAVRFGGDPETRDLDEFFVVRRHRRSGVGRALATWLWDRRPTSWLVRVFQGNRPAVSFWREAISRYTGGHLVEEARSVEGRAWIYFRFSGGSREQVDRRSMDP